MKRYIETVKILLKIAKDKNFVVLQMFISNLLCDLSSLLPPIATAGIIAVITDNNFGGIWYYVFLYLVFYIIYFVTLKWNYNTYTVLANYYHLEVQKKLFEHVVENDSVFDKISKGKIVDTASDDIRYLVDVMDAASDALVGLIQLAVILVVFCHYSLTVGLFALAIHLLYLLLMNKNAKRVSKYYEGTRKYEDKIIDIFNQMLANIKQIKSLNILPNLNKRLDKTRARWADEYNARRKAVTDRYCRMPYIMYTGKILLYIYLAYLVVNKTISLDKLVLLISYFELAIGKTDIVLTDLLNLSYYGIRVKRIQNVLNYTSANNVDFGTIENDYINGAIVFDKVNYSIRNKAILNNVSFKIYPNEITAIVGHSGSGKTTIVNLLYRLDRVKSGKILMDNESIYEYSKKSYTSNLTGVFQKPFVFEMSIRDNLSLIDASHNRQVEVCKMVGIHDVIEKLPKGYNTILKEDERLLSDGDKQLLVIARALLTKSEILLFDEVTSNIDPASTIKIGGLLEELKQDHTIIMVTHKPEMMEIADRVIVLDKGKVVAKGLNEEVLKKCDLYKELKSRSFASVSRVENEII